MNRHATKLIREGEYLMEVEVELIDSPEGWSPCLSLADAKRLDAARAALARGDLAAAGRIGRLFRLTQIRDGV